MTRRRLVQQVLLILGIQCAVPTGCAPPTATPKGSSSADVRPAENLLSASEMQDLVAFGEVLVSDRPLTPIERQFLVEHIDERIRASLDYVALYRSAVSLLDLLAGRRLASLDLPERMALVARHRLAVAPGRGEELRDEMRSLRTQTGPDLIRGYYGSPAGWAAVGYDSFPGRCADLARYTRPEA